MKGRGFWKLNTAFLRETEYIENVNEILGYGEFRYHELDPSSKWESIERDVREYSIQYGQIKASQRKFKKKRLLELLEYWNKLNQLEKRLACINLQADNAVILVTKVNDKIDSIKRELEEIQNFETIGSIIRSKATWYEHGETNSRYFMKLEKTSGKNESNANSNI